MKVKIEADISFTHGSQGRRHRAVGERQAPSDQRVGRRGQPDRHRRHAPSLGLGLLRLRARPLQYQIYHEKQSFGGNYAFFGWYDANSTQENSNPSPFPSGVATADKDGTCVLLRVPPK